jgi:hypothetical protein
VGDVVVILWVTQNHGSSVGCIKGQRCLLAIKV